MDPTDLEIEKFIAATAAVIDRHGYQIIAVGSGGCSVAGCRCEPELRPWAYTVGLTLHGHPELLSFGLSELYSGPLINWIAYEHFHGHTLPVGRNQPLMFRGLHVRLVPVPEQSIDRTQDVMGQWYNQFERWRPVPPPDVLQVVVADHEARFPWDAAYDGSRRFTQPVLADRPDALHAEPRPMTRRRDPRTNRPPKRRR
jgi:hypothetical protein